MQLTRAADGHLSLYTSSRLAFLWLGFRLWWRGVRREGRTAGTMFERSFPDYVRGDVRIWCGYEGTMGFDLHATCDKGDEVLRVLVGNID